MLVDGDVLAALTPGTPVLDLIAMILLAAANAASDGSQLPKQ